MKQLNRVELIGIVGNVHIQEYAEMKQARIGLATNYAYKDRSGNTVIDTSWHHVIAWEGRNMPNLSKIENGTKLHVFGRIRYRKYTGEDDVEHFGVDIIASKIDIINNKQSLGYEVSGI